MPRVADADRKRAKRPKTKTGCTTCKIRKVKCDETKPECDRCTSTGRKCDGYSPSTTKSRSPRPGSAAAKTTSSSSASSKTLSPRGSRSISPVPIQPSSVFNTPAERSAFSFFLARTSPQLAGFYTCDFWNSVLPQAAHIDAGIRHAIVALSSVHRLFEETGDADKAGAEAAFGMQHYQLAIRQHIDDMQRFSGNVAALASGKGKEGLESYLASSMLFICIEMLQSHYVSAISLTKVAVQLFYEYVIPATYTRSSSPPLRSAWPLAIFESLLARLQAKAVGLVGRSAVGILVPPRIKRVDTTNPPVPAKFASVEEARSFYDDYDWALSFSSHDPEIYGVQDDLRNPVMHKRHHAIMTAWNAAFNALLGDLDPNALSQRDRNAIAVLQVRRMQSQITFEMVLRDELADCNPMLWDEYHSTFSAAMARLEVVLRTQDNLDRVAAPPSPLSTANGSHETPPKPPRHLFTLDFGLVAPLYETAGLCRDPSIRRKAIRLLRAHPMREGMWDSLLAARAAEARMELEERMAWELLPDRVREARTAEGREGVIEGAEEIVRDARIITVLPDFVPGQRWARMWFSKLPASSPMCDRPREWHFERVIYW